MGEFKILAKKRSELQKLLNQWKHKYTLLFHYINYFHEIDSFVAIIERTPIKVCPHGTLGGVEHCMKCKGGI